MHSTPHKCPTNQACNGYPESGAFIVVCRSVGLPDPLHSAPLQTQACNSYPESGVCDAATWRLLLGADAKPAIISQLRSGQSDDEDLGEQVRVLGSV